MRIECQDFSAGSSAGEAGAGERRESYLSEHAARARELPSGAGACEY
ncbi:MAG TPA: hypothetical protein VK388_12900 [Pyrinomonadaceae bacterium]|nr:hypothetical protein [Pyrinomonadaceae bacterium]